MKCPKCGHEFTLRYTRDWWREHAGHYIYCPKCGFRIRLEELLEEEKEAKP